MRALLVTAALALASVAPAAAQSVGGNASLSVTSSTARVAFPADRSKYPSVILAPAAASTQEIFYKLGDNTVSAATTDSALPAGGICINVGPNTNVAAITATSTATLRVTQLTTCAFFASRGGGGGGGGGITALTGDVTASGSGSVAATIATAQPGAHTWAAAQTFTVAPVFTDASGSRTALGLGALATVTPGTGVSTALGVNVGSAGAVVVNGGALGTPSSGVATNLTGTASGLTAGTVTTNANLTGDVTSVGNATTLATAQSGAHTWSASNEFSVAGAVSTPGVLLSGAWVASNTASQLLVQSPGASAFSGASAAGTGIGVNAASGFTGTLIDAQLNGSSVFRVTSGGGTIIASAQAYSWAGRGILTSTGAGSLKIGSVDAASPVAQTLSVQNAININNSGVNFNINGSVSAGAGTSGDIIINTGATGAGSGVQNAQVPALTIKGNTQLVQLSKTYTVSTLPTCTAGLTGALSVVTDATTPTYNGTLTGGSNVTVPVFCNGSAWTSH